MKAKIFKYYLPVLLLSFTLFTKLLAQAPELRVPATHEASHFVFSKDDRLFASLGESELKIWQTEGTYLLKSLPMPGSDTLYDTDLHFTPDNSKLVLIQNGRVSILNLLTFSWEKSVWKIEFSGGTGLSGDGRFLYYFASDYSKNEGKLLKLDLVTGKSAKLLSFKVEEGASYGGKLSFNADESLLLASGLIDDGGVLIDLKNLKVVRQFKAPYWPLFINPAGNLIVNSKVLTGNSDQDTYGTNKKFKVEEIDPGTMKVLRTMTVATKSDDIPDYNGILWISDNGRDKILYEMNERFYIANTTSFTQSKRQQAKFNIESGSTNSASLSTGGKFVFWSGYMTAFKTDNVKTPYQFGISPYQPFMLSDVSQGNDVKILAGNRLVNFDARGLSFTHLPKAAYFDFHSSYRYLPSQKRLFMEGVEFNFNDGYGSGFTYDLGNDLSQFTPISMSNDISYDVHAMREYDSLHTIILLCSDRFFTMDTRTLKVKQQVMYGNEYSVSVNLGQTNDDHGCALSPDLSKVIVVLQNEGSNQENSSIVCYNLINKKQLWNYLSKTMISNPVYSDNGKTIRFFNEAKACVTLDALNGKVLSSASLLPQADYTSQFSPTQKFVLTKSFKNELFFGGISNYDVYDAATKKQVISLPQQRIAYKAAIFVSDDRFLLTQDEDLKLWDLASGKLIARIILFQNSNDWILITPDGRFDGSDGGLNQLYYVKGRDIIPLEQLYEGFYTPGLTIQVLAGVPAENKHDIATISSPPTVELTFAPSKNAKELLLDGQILEVNVDEKTIQVIAEATCSEGVVTEIRLFHNGKLVGNTKRNLTVENESSKNDKKVFDIELMEGENHLKAVAINSQRTESKPDEIVFTYKPKASQVTPANENQITLHMIVIGINKYKNPKYNLNYAIADASAFKETFERGISYIFTKSNIVFLTDEKATKEGISAELDKVKATAQAKDIFVFYYAGHGVLNDKKDFFLVPHDVTQLYGNDDALAQKGLSANQLQQYSKDIKAQKQLFILDACQSAGALDQVMASRGVAEEKAIAQLARATGTHWLTASGSEQFASEFSQLGHGTFTYVLLEALSGKADTGDKKITVNEIDAYLQEQVPEVTTRFKGTPQYPASYGFGNDFPLIILK